MNISHGLSAAIFATLTQAIVAFFMTLYVNKSVDFIYLRTENTLVKAALPVVGTVAVQASVLMLAHAFASTPHIIETVALPICLTVLYCSYLTYMLSNISVKQRFTRS